MLLKDAITIIEIIAVIGAALLLGDYLGHKIGRFRLVQIVVIVMLVAIVAFAILAGVVLSRG